MASKFFFLLTICSFFLVSFQHEILITPSKNRHSVSHFAFAESLLASQRGDTVEGINLVKKYLQRFGYLTPNSADQLTDVVYTSKMSYDNYFDEVTEAATKAYQLNHCLEPTGMIDNGTLAALSEPRCGVPDTVPGEKSLNKTYCHGNICIRYGSHYAFTGPKWPVSMYHLTYGFEPGFPDKGKQVLTRCFNRWASVSKFTFTAITDFNTADIEVSFEVLDHGDGLPFDGHGGILAHAFPPTDGRVHFDGDEIWSDGAVKNAVDLGTVALHEIGHILGLKHSKIHEAVMWAGIPLGATKDLNQDDISGIQALYKL